MFLWGRVPAACRDKYTSGLSCIDELSVFVEVGAADAEIKVSAAENLELSRSEYGFARLASCQ